MAGKVYLLPITMGDGDAKEVIPTYVIERILSIRFFVVENIRTTRRFLRKLDSGFPIDESQFFELNKHTKAAEIGSFLNPCTSGNNIGVMSEAGVPGVADPGSDVVAIAHQQNIQVVPLVGPSSILMGVMASGLNGQNFAFNGYIPIKGGERVKRIKQLEKRMFAENQAQVFIETPYRNNALLNDFLSNCVPEAKLCIAANITSEDEFIKTLKIKEWKKQKIDLNKIPTIFILGS